MCLEGQKRFMEGLIGMYPSVVVESIGSSKIELVGVNPWAPRMVQSFLNR